MAAILLRSERPLNQKKKKLKVQKDLLDLSELVTVAQDQVHVFVERFERADEDSPVLQDTAHPEVDVLQHLTALTDRLEHKQDERV